MTALARVVRKTRRKNLAQRVASAVAGIELAFVVMLIRAGAGGWQVNLALGLLLMACVFGEDRVNGLLSLRQIPPDSREVNTAFQEDGYTSRTRSGERWWPYRQIRILAETEDYFIFVLDRTHRQVFDKRGFTWGSAEELRTLLERKTGKKVRTFR